MNGAHHFPHGIKWGLRNARHCLLHFAFPQPERCGIVHKRAFRRFADGLLCAVLQGGVAAKGERARQERFVRAAVPHDGHLVLCQRSCFVGADDLRAAERFHRREFTDDCILL